MKDHKYILQPYKGMKSRHRCPGCNRPEKTFSLYIDTETGKEIDPKVGRCNREVNCGYHYTPKDFFADSGLSENKVSSTRVRARARDNNCNVTSPVSFINVEVFKNSLSGYDGNFFVQFLVNLLGEELAVDIVSKYYVGTSKHWPGSVVFWQIDIKRRIRSGKIMLYSPNTGKRIKEPFNHITWVHKALKSDNFNLRQCLFGEHLLSDNSKPVAIVESEKTAIIASAYLPDFIWLASGSLTNLTAANCQVLKGRPTTLFPDLNGFEKWSLKAKELSGITNFQVSDLLESKASPQERERGLDLADYLVRFSPGEFSENYARAREAKIKTQAPTDHEFSYTDEVKFSENKPFSENYARAREDLSKPILEDWTLEIEDITRHFSNVHFAGSSVRLDECTVITDCRLFIDRHLSMVKANNGKRAYRPYLDRLQDLKVKTQNSLTI